VIRQLENIFYNFKKFIIMVVSYLYRIIKFALQDFYRNIWLSLATITILTLTLLSINSLVAFNSITEAAAKVVEDKIDISVYFKSGANNEEVDEMKKYITSLPEVAEINYISKEEALQQFRDNHKDETTILDVVDELGDNPLGPTIRIKARTVEGYPNILQAIDKPEYNKIIDSKDYNDRQLMINQISEWTGAGREIVLIFISLFILISALIVFNTIRVAIYTHREEIAIEKLVGATNWFVRLPFLLEGVVYALFSCLLIIVIIYPLLGLAEPYVSRFFGPDQVNLVNYFNSNFILIFGFEFIVISFINIVASFLAARKYLKV